MTRPFFVVSSGGSGTALVAKALGISEEVTSEHEYALHAVQPLSVYRHRGLVDAETVQGVLSQTHGAAVHYARTPLWGDSSSKLSWLIPDLAALFPDALFIHLVRDGRKVAKDTFGHPASESYDHRGCQVLSAHLADPANVPAPPPEKRYWWAQPLASDPFALAFATFNRFERICWHWAEVNRVILRDVAAVPRHRLHFARLEDLREKPSAVMNLFHFLGLPYRDEYRAHFARPNGAGRAADKLLDPEQAAQFERIAGTMLAELGYAQPLSRAVNA